MWLPNLGQEIKAHQAGEDPAHKQTLQDPAAEALWKAPGRARPQACVCAGGVEAHRRPRFSSRFTMTKSNDKGHRPKSIPTGVHARGAQMAKTTPPGPAPTHTGSHSRPRRRLIHVKRRDEAVKRKFQLPAPVGEPRPTQTENMRCRGPGNKRRGSEFSQAGRGLGERRASMVR